MVAAVAAVRVDFRSAVQIPQGFKLIRKMRSFLLIAFATWTFYSSFATHFKPMTQKNGAGIECDGSGRSR